MRAVGPLDNVPVAVVTVRSTLADSGRTEPYRSPLLPGDAVYLVVEDSGHHIQIDRPDAVVDVVKRVVEAARVP